MTLFYVLLSVALLAALVLLALGYVTFVSFARRGSRRSRKFAAQEGTGTHSEWVRSLPQEALTLRSRDGLLLCATYLPCPTPSRKTVLLFHGYLGNSLDHMGMFVPYYRERGFNVLLADNRAHGKSEGAYIGFGQTDSVDCVDWCRALLRRYPTTEALLLHGISMGGATVDCAAGRADIPKEVRGVISDCAFSSCKEQFRVSLRAITKIPPAVLLPLADLFCRALAHYSIFSDGAEEGVRRAVVPFLFIHGGEDRFVPTRMVNTLYDACTDPAKVKWIVPTAKHFVSFLVDPEGYRAHLDTFLRRIGL